MIGPVWDHPDLRDPAGNWLQIDPPMMQDLPQFQRAIGFCVQQRRDTAPGRIQ